MEGRGAPSHSGMQNWAANQGLENMNAPLNQPISNLPSTSIGTGLQIISPMSASHMVPNDDNEQDIEPFVIHPVDPAAANVRNLNDIAQAQADLVVISSIDQQSVGGAPMPLSMIFSGMTPSVHTVRVGNSSNVPSVVPHSWNDPSVVPSIQSAVTSMASPVQVTEIGQPSQMYTLFNRVTFSVPQNSSHNMSRSWNSLHIGSLLGQAAPAMDQSTLQSTQMGQSVTNRNQTMLHGISTSYVPSSGAIMMMPTPGLSQSLQTGMQQQGANNYPTATMSMSQQTLSTPQSSPLKYAKFWEGDLIGQLRSQPVVTRLEGYRSRLASQDLQRAIAYWPSRMLLGRLIYSEHIDDLYNGTGSEHLKFCGHNKSRQYQRKADRIVFRAISVHGYLQWLREKKLSAVVPLHSQTLIISPYNDSRFLVGQVFPGDSDAFNRRISALPRLLVLPLVLAVEQHHIPRLLQQQLLHQHQQPWMLELETCPTDSQEPEQSPPMTEEEWMNTMRRPLR